MVDTRNLDNGSYREPPEVGKIRELDQPSLDQHRVCLFLWTVYQLERERERDRQTDTERERERERDRDRDRKKNNREKTVERKHEL